MMPCHFGPPASPLFGAYHEPALRSRSTAVLLCYPIGHEYMSAHPAFRDLAAALAQAGFPVLRFDYWGTGDSSGAQADAALARWEASVDLAADELKDMAGVSRLGLVGLRFGAVLAARYAARAPVRDLLLWDPVVRGGDYLAGLRAVYNAGLRVLKGTPVKAAPVTETSVEIGGFLYPDPLRAAITAIDLGGPGDPPPAHVPRRTELVCGQDLPVYRALAQRLPGNVKQHVVADASPWDRPDCWGDPLRAGAIIDRIVERLKQEAP